MSTWAPLVVLPVGGTKGPGDVTAILASVCLVTAQPSPFSEWHLLNSEVWATQGFVCIICPVASTGLCPAMVPCSPCVCVYVFALMQGPPSAEDPPK